MAINIPQIKRADPVSQGSIGREQVTAPSIEPYVKNLNTITSFANNAAELAFKYEAQAQDNQVRDLTNKYKAGLYGTGEEKESWTVTRFQKTPKDGQDFTPAFAGYQTHKQSLRDSILSDVSGGVAEKLQTQLADVDFYADRTVNVEFYKANNVRTDKIHSAEIELIKQVDIPAAVGAYNPKDPDTIKQLATTFNKIADSSMAHGLKLGFKEGDPLLQSMMREDVGEAVVKSVNDALSIKDTDKATQIWMQFQDMVPNKKAEPMKKKIADIVIDKEIDTWANKYTGMSEDVGLNKIQKEAPEQLREEIQDRYIKIMTRKSEQFARISEGAKNVAARQLLMEKQLGTAPSTVKQLQANPAYADLLNKMNVGDAQYVYNIIGARSKTGNPTKYNQLLEMWKTGDMDNWDTGTFEKETSDLSPKEYNGLKSKMEKNRWTADRRRLYNKVKQVVDFELPNNGSGQLVGEGEKAWLAIIDPWLSAEIMKKPNVYNSEQDLLRDAQSLQILIRDKIRKAKEDKKLVIPEDFGVTVPVTTIRRPVVTEPKATVQNQNAAPVQPTTAKDKYRKRPTQ